MADEKVEVQQNKVKQRALAPQAQIMGVPKIAFFMLVIFGVIALVALLCGIIGMQRGNEALAKAKTLDGQRTEMASKIIKNTEDVKKTDW